MSVIPIAEFAPDQPDVPSSTSDTILNVIPITAQSYGPLPSFQSYSTALNARCQGGLSVADASGNLRVYSGNATKLYRQSAASTTPADVSKVGGYVASSTGIWSFSLFGTRIIATDFTDPPQSYVEGSSTLFANLIVSGVTSLQAKYVGVVRDHVVFVNTTDATYGNQPQRVWWTAINDPTNVPTPGTQAAANALSDFQDNVGPHGQATGIAPDLGTIDAAIFYERAIYRMVFSGLPDIYDFQKVTTTRGLLCPGGLAVLDNVAYHIAEDGLYKFDGTVPVPIGKHKIDKFFYSDFNLTYLDRVSSAVDPTNGLVAFAYPGVGAVNGVANRILFYSPTLDRFTVTDTGSVNAEVLIRGATFNTSLEGLDAFSSSIDALAFSLDSPVWNAGRALLAGFDSNHKFGYFNGSNLAATIVTSDFEPIPGNQAQVLRARPLLDATSCTIAAAGRDDIDTAPIYGMANSRQVNGSVPLRTRGRYHRQKVVIPAGTAWTQFSGIDLEEVMKLGSR